MCICIHTFAYNIIIFYPLWLFLIIVFCQCCKTFQLKVCQDHSILLGSDDNMVKIVDITLGSTVHVLCNFCAENDSCHKGVWYYRRRGRERTMTEIITTKNSNIYYQPFDSLYLTNFKENNSGIYTCHKPPDLDRQSIFTYLLDGVFNGSSKPKVVTTNQWQDYKHNKIDYVNNYLEKSQNKFLALLREEYRVSFKITIIWDDWGPCELYSNTKGIRKKLGRCRLHPVYLKNITKTQLMKNKKDVDLLTQEIIDYYFIDKYYVSCRSIILSYFLPEVSFIVRSLAEYEATEYCNIKFDTVTGKYIKESSNAIFFKDIDTKEIAEYGHLTLSCSKTGSFVKWFKDNKLLNSSFRNNMALSEEEPHLTIDIYGTLYILHATQNEEGLYTCHTEGNDLQQATYVRVVSKYKLLNHDFLRYSLYLGFVLLLTSICYFAGILVAWNRRSSFLDPLKLNRAKYHSRFTSDNILK